MHEIKEKGGAMGIIQKLPLFLWPIPPLIFWAGVFNHSVLKNHEIDGFKVFQYFYFGSGTICYIAYWLFLVFDYPKARKEYLESWMGRSIRVASISGILVTFFFSLGFGVFVFLLFIAKMVKNTFKQSR